MTAPQFVFNVLGPLAVIRSNPETGESEPLAVPSGRPRAVLACLLVDAGRPVHPEALVEAGWGDALPENPRAALHTVISRLRHTLKDAELSSGPAGYTLHVSDAAIDARRFEALCGAARRCSPMRATELFADALSLWRGPAYAEFADRDFATSEAARLERLRCDVIEEDAAAAIACGQHEVAVAELEALLTDHPFREHAVELLMTALYWAGRHADALGRFRAHRKRLADELGLDPMPALRELEARILGQDLPVPGDAGPTFDPVVWLDISSTFIGRDSELSDLLGAVADNRVVTVCGTGGVGKSRLVAQALPRLGETCGLPIVVTELAQVAEGQVVTAVADAVGVGGGADRRTGLVEYLGVTGLLLVLDNCEHLRAEVAELADLVVHRCPRVRVVATSRHRLGLGTERVVLLDPLAVPAEGVAEGPTRAAPAVELFLDRVRRLRPDFEIASWEPTRVGEICRQLDGLPLAVELAAARAAALGIAPVHAALVRASDAGTATLAGLEDVVRWSTRLLTKDQQRLLSQLTVFAGRFDAAAVVALAARLWPWSNRRDGTEAIMAALTELVESHLLTVETQDGRMTYRMLTLVRSFVESHLVEPADRPEVRLAHAEWAQMLAAQAAHQWVSGEGLAAGAKLQQGSADLAATLRWSIDYGRLDIAAATISALQLCLHWLPSRELGDLILDVGRRCAEAADPVPAAGVAAGALAHATRGDAAAARRLATRALSEPSGDDGRFLARLAMALASFYSGDHDESLIWLGRIDELPDLADGHRADAWVTAALVACYRDDLGEARDWASAALTATDAAGAAAAYAFALYASGEIEVREDRDRGAALFRASAAAADRIGAAHVNQVARLALLAVLVRLDQRDDALKLARPLLQDIHRVGSWPQIWTILRIVAELLVRWDRWEDAALLLRAVDAAPGAPPLLGEDEQRYAGLRVEMREHLGDAVFERIGDVGIGLPRAHVVDRALTVLFRLSEQHRTGHRSGAQRLVEEMSQDRGENLR